MNFEELYKTDLHNHLDGSILMSTCVDIINQQKIVTKHWTMEDIEQGKITPEFLGQIVYARTDMKDLLEYLRAFDVTGACMQTELNLIRVVNETISNAAKSNIKHIELRYAPAFHTSTGLTQQQVQNIVAKAAKEASVQFKVSVIIIICTMKLFAPDSEITQATFALYDQQYPVPIAYDQAGPECMFQFTDYQKQTDTIKVPITLHAGEAAGAEAVKSAVLVGRATRVGHGVRSFESTEVMELLRDRKIYLEMCPTSNTQTNVQGISKTLEDYPLKKYLDFGIKVTLNTDNAMISRCSVASELELMTQKLNLEPVDILMITNFGFEAAFNPNAEEKEKLREEAFKWNVKCLSKYDPEVEKKFCERMKLFQ
ncbi:Adenosine_deaminase [Hexamita inflata]|uniref:adenosine deaminase n=1 Tax=Hexamita inflata TaxID=28002 RepID=A0ABP1GGQ1_9EUKA